ncbi:chromosome partitioning protein [Paracoccus sp. MKU1]|uniref:chromosome partitioning protein n=1 Tax=Paracoccus sp. MKU1 TaxID=1745182 RepID=UPI000719230C|nr:chromosome partitioning protein [Paracoccus sp. MKU1]KRW96449.1 chromosome partitioning protein [Paracoccus sp. MKU1]
MTPAKGNDPDRTPAGQAAPDAARGHVSSKFIRREAALAASDAKHAKISAQRFSLLRTRILREMRSRGWSTLAVVPVTPGAGGTFVAVNLALALARQPHTQVALIDLDLGSPSVAGQLGIPGCAAVSAALRAGGDLEMLVSQVDEAPNLSVLAPQRAETDAAELLQDEALAQAMRRLHDSHPAEIAVIDTAALLGEDAALAALPLADALLLVADGHRGTAADMAECERLLVGMPPVMGVVLNKSED